MTAPLHDCVIRFWQETGAGRKVAGTGFLTIGVDGQTYALTCAHVANLALGRNLTEDSPPQHGASVTVDLMGRGGSMTLDLLEWRPPAPLNGARATDVADIAVFAPRAPFAAPYRPPLRIEPPSRVAPPGERVAFHSFGFMGTQNGVSTQGALTAVDAGGWFVADGDEEFRRFIEEGLSGAPVFADGRVLGMVVQRLERDARQGLVIPAFALARAWPPLASPYPGLPAFDSDTAHLFFGRGRAVAPDAEPTGTLKELLDRLSAQRLVALMGASGSGKSSLAKAGVADVYRRWGWIVLTLRPGLEPLRNLAEAIASAVEGLKPSPERIQAMDRWEKALEANRLAEALALARGQGASGVLIVIDQFEEFFPGREDRADAARTEVLATEMARQRAVILPQLRRAVERGEAHCLLTARLDLIEAMVSADEEAAKLFKDPYPIFVLTRMAAGEAREAIEGPADLFGARADAGFATDLAAAATQGEGRLPLLQETLRQCWAGLRRGPDGWRLQPPTAAETSDPARLLEESLARRGEQALAALRPDLKDPADLTDVQRVLLALVRLVAGQPVRRLLPLADLPPDDRALLDRLADERLVVIDGERRTAELVHEALMVRWPQLAAWIDGQRGFLEWRDRFERDFAAWREGGREAKDALRRHDLATAQDWADGAARVRGRPTADQTDFIAASRAVHEAEDRRKAEQLRRTKQWLQMAVLALALLAVTLAYAWFEGKRAESEALRAEAQTGIAEKQADIARQQSALAQDQAKRAEDRTEAAQRQESRTLAILAQQESRRGDQGTAMLLALAALPDPGFGGKRPLSVEAGTALRQAWMRNREMALIGHKGMVIAASFSPGGRRIVTASSDGTARVWDLSGDKPTATILEGHESIVSRASFSPDGRRIVTASWDDTARVWDLSRDKPTATILEGHKGAVTEASFSPDGRRIVTASSDNTARVWDLSGDKPTATILEGHKGMVNAASFSPDGRRIVTALSDKTARVWDLSGAKPTATILEGHKDTVRSASFSPDGRRIVT
ncbi:AAA family ATPase, partial [Azospirillum sp.]|uniref:nSTAND1 domain-containing NTPase n=1 Tax=Azospirillum sp. TaxID=34012 RepID=UPI00260C7304